SSVDLGGNRKPAPQRGSSGGDRVPGSSSVLQRREHLGGGGEERTGSTGVPHRCSASAPRVTGIGLSRTRRDERARHRGGIAPSSPSRPVRPDAGGSSRVGGADAPHERPSTRSVRLRRAARVTLAGSMEASV